MRDRGETGCGAETGATEKLCADKIGQDGYVYCFRNNKWTLDGYDLKDHAINAEFDPEDVD